jgi:hypothetical protein
MKPIRNIKGVGRNKPSRATRHRPRTIRLPCYGITVRLTRKHTRQSPGCGTITSQLKAQETGGRYRAVVDALESLILAHACAGIDVVSPAYVEGIETAVDAIANRF